MPLLANRLLVQNQIDQVVCFSPSCLRGLWVPLGLGVCITNWLEHYAPVYQFYGQAITNVETHAFEDTVREVNDDIPRTIAWVLAFHGCPH